MQMLAFSTLLTLMVGSVAAHSWLECVDTVVKNKDYAKAHPSSEL